MNHLFDTIIWLFAFVTGIAGLVFVGFMSYIVLSSIG